MTKMDSAISKAPGTVGVAAKHLRTGTEFRHNADELFFTASTFKVPLLVELYRQVDQGKIDLAERVELTNAVRVPGSGVLKNLGTGLQPTLHDLAMLMIIISDNSATDILYEKVGGENINNTMRELGLTKTRIPMTTRQLLYSIVGLDPQDPMHTYQMASDKLFIQQYVPDADGFSEEKSDVSSPGDMSLLLELLHEGDILSPSSREGALDILKRQQLNNVIPLKLPPSIESAHKTGSYRGVRCDVGIVYSPSGPYTVAIMAKGVSGLTLEVDLALADISRSIYDGFNP